MLPVLLGVAVIIFTIMYFVPGDVTMSILGGNATDAEREYLREQLGLNRPYIIRLFEFLKQLFLHFDMGTSYITGKAILPELLERLPRTIIIALGSIFIAVVLGLPLGITAAVHQNTILDRLSIFVSLLGVSVPNFWLALLLIILFTLNLKILPSFGFGGVKYFIMPWMT
jgi:peptide/nickel transport system permease protein